MKCEREGDRKQRRGRARKGQEMTGRRGETDRQKDRKRQRGTNRDRKLDL